MSAADRSKRIAQLNDELRGRAGLPSPGGLGEPTGLVVLTRGIIELPVERIADVLQRVRSFDAFTQDNDPHREHDFGSFEAPGVGKVFWKIEYYADRSCQFGSEDPSDPERCFRVLTIMLAEEY